MNKCSYFVKNKALFGSYPGEEQVAELEANGVKYFVDLTCDGERNIVKYKPSDDSVYINYPIVDHRVPSNWGTFARFIIRVTKIIKELNPDEKVYVHCKGGHGRAGIVVACILCHLYKIPQVDALVLTSKYHHDRSEMRDKWREIGSPQSKNQKAFVTKFFTPLTFYQVYSRGYTTGFSNMAPFGVVYNEEEFKTSDDAIKKFGEEHAYDIIKAKFEQNPAIKESLTNTGIRPLWYHLKGDLHWGCWNGDGENKLGKMLYAIRDEFYNE